MCCHQPCASIALCRPADTGYYFKNGPCIPCELLKCADCEACAGGTGCKDGRKCIRACKDRCASAAGLAAAAFMCASSMGRMMGRYSLVVACVVA